ncbi:MAG: hypothetical protein ACO265_05680 [Polynucleobacter sp.]
MPLVKTLYKPGVNRENTRYTTEGGWFVSDKVRFRQGTPEKIGGWARISSNTFIGTCRSLWNWITLTANNLMGVGTSAKYYIEKGGVYFDITPIRQYNYTATLSNPFDTTSGSDDVTVNDTAHGAQVGDLVYFTGASAVGGFTASQINTRHVIATVINANSYTIVLDTNATSTVTGGGGTVTAEYYINAKLLGTDPFATTNGSPTVTVTATAHGGSSGDYVTFSGASTVAGLDLNNEYVMTVVDANSFTIAASANASSTTTGGGSSVRASYQITIGPGFQVPQVGWGAGNWNQGTWGGVGTFVGDAIRLWSANNFGEDLVFGPRGGGVYYWDATNGLSARGVNIETLPGALDTPVIQNLVFVSDIYRFVFCFGTNDIGSSVQDPMLIRWADQESVTDWLPTASNQAGSLRLSHGSKIMAVAQTRQEILVWTDTALYSVQYLGAPLVWGAQLLADNISIVGPNAASVAAGVAYWMGVDKFYKYDGRVQTLNCDLRKYIYQDINTTQYLQYFSGTNEGFNEVWWFYCSSGTTNIDRYVVYNYMENIWYYGTMARTAWFDAGLRDYPQAATYSSNLVNHEFGNDDNVSGIPVAINAYIESAEFDIQDGHNIGFVYRVLPDITFTGSTTNNPQVTMSLIPMMNSGSGYNNPQSLAGQSYAAVARTSTTTIEQFTGQVYVRVRGRQMIFKVESSDLGSAWQLGSPRIDIKQDGRATGQGA